MVSMDRRSVLFLILILLMERFVCRFVVPSSSILDHVKGFKYRSGYCLGGRYIYEPLMSTSFSAIDYIGSFCSAYYSDLETRLLPSIPAPSDLSSWIRKIQLV